MGETDFFLDEGDTPLEGDDTLLDRSSDVCTRLALWELSDRSLKNVASTEKKEKQQFEESRLNELKHFKRLNCTVVFPFSLCASPRLFRGLFPPSASLPSSPCSCASLCASSQRRGGRAGQEGEGWACGGPSSYCGCLWRA